MRRFLLALLTIGPLSAQLIVDTYAGGVIRSGVPANSAAIGTINGIAWDPAANIVYCDQLYNVIRRVGTNGMIETIAGTGVTGFGGDGGPAVSALLSSPMNPHFDGAGNLYFWDQLNGRLRRIDTGGIITTIAGDGQIPLAGLDTLGPATSRSLPEELSFNVDASGNVYIADPGNGRILRIVSGNLVMFAQVSSPTGLAIDGNGNVYVSTSPTPGSILKVSPAGVVSTFATFPSGLVPYEVIVISTDAAGNVYATFNGALLRYSPDGTSTTLPAPANIYPPLAIDPKGNLAFGGGVTADAYVSNSAILTYTTQSVLTTVAGGAPQPAPDGTPLRDAWFLGPLSLSFSPTGDLYIGEFGACLIRKISAAGVLSTFAGTGTCGYPAPSGTAKTANLVYPVSIAVDNQSDVWVADDFLNLYSISQTGALSPIVETPVTGSKGRIAVDAKDRVYVVGDFSFFRVLAGGVYQNIPNCGTGLGTDSAGNVYCLGSLGTYVVNDDATVTLKYPNFGGEYMAFDPSGNIWSNGLSTLNASGNASLGLYEGFAGDGGPLQSARLYSFGSIGFGPDGNLYFVDANLDGNTASPARIRRVTGPGPSAPPVISQGGIVNAVSYAGGSVSPGELVSIFGSNFGATGLRVNTAVNNRIPATLGRTKVLFGGIPGVITAITPNQINVFVPYILTPGSTANVQVQVDNVLSAPVAVSVVPTAPGLSTPILNQDGTLNSAANPAARGSIVSLFGTGLGAMSPQLLDGYLVISTPYSAPVSAPVVMIGGQNAKVLYAGDAPTLSTGVFQINASIPTSITTGGVPVAVGTSNSVNVFVK